MNLLQKVFPSLLLVVAASPLVQAQDDSPPFEIDFGLSGSWYNPDTPGQGWMIDVSPVDNLFFATWFTWRGEGDYDWYTVQGNYVGDRARLPLLRTSGGRFNDPAPTEIEVVGEAEFLFEDCLKGRVHVRFEDGGIEDEIPLYRITAAPDACLEPAAKVAFRFGHRTAEDGSEDFVAVTNNASLIAQLRAQLELSADERSLFVIGSIDYGNGGHNLDWSWHLVPNAWHLTEASIELCDGHSSLVEADLAYWVETVTRFCPWSSYVKAELAEGEE